MMAWLCLSLLVLSASALAAKPGQQTNRSTRPTTTAKATENEEQQLYAAMMDQSNSARAVFDVLSEESRQRMEQCLAQTHSQRVCNKVVNDWAQRVVAFSAPALTTSGRQSNNRTIQRTVGALKPENPEEQRLYAAMSGQGNNARFVFDVLGEEATQRMEQCLAQTHNQRVCNKLVNEWAQRVAGIIQSNKGLLDQRKNGTKKSIAMRSHTKGTQASVLEKSKL